MINPFIRLAAFSIVLSFSCVLTSASRAEISLPPASAFAMLPATTHVDISPNGQLIAMGDCTATQEKVVVFDADTGKTRATLGMERATKLRGIHWIDDETVIIDFSVSAEQKVDFTTNHYEIWRSIALDVPTGKNRLLLMGEGSRSLVTAAYMVSRHTSEPKHVIMSSLDFSQASTRMSTGTRLANERNDGGWVSVLFDVDVRTGKGKPIEQGTPYTETWLALDSGQPAARSEWNPKSHTYQILAKRNGAWREIYQSADDTTTLIGISEDQSAVYTLVDGAAGYRELWAVALDGSGRKPIVAEPDLDVESAIGDSMTGHVLGVNLGVDGTRVKWLNTNAQAQSQTLANTFPNKFVGLLGHSADNQRVVVGISSPSAPRVYYLVDFKTHRADTVGEEYAALADVPLGTVRLTSYKARDGSEIPAYLTLPAGIEAKQLPMIVLPHGGPEARDVLAFDWWAQFLATRGYLVLQPQFRGSTGFGEKFRLAGYGEWGGLMQNDVTDGVQAMIDQGLADAKRICIVGASYGGYAALAGAALTPDLYRCAVSVAGVSDLPDMLATTKNGWQGDDSNELAYWRTSIGSPLDPRIAAHSPNRIAARIKIPILLLHGEADSIVPISQSEKMARTLDQMGRPYKFVRLPGEDHWLSRAETRLTVLTELEQFLKANLSVQPK